MCAAPVSPRAAPVGWAALIHQPAERPIFRQERERTRLPLFNVAQAYCSGLRPVLTARFYDECLLAFGISANDTDMKPRIPALSLLLVI